jgi:putative flippase GtrA
MPGTPPRHVSSLMAWGAAIATAAALVLFAWQHGEWWVPGEGGSTVNLWAARALLFLVTTVATRGIIALVPRMNRLRYALVGGWSAYFVVLTLVGWPGTLMSDSVQQLFQAQHLIVETWFSWVYGLANIALLDIVPQAWFLTLVQALGTGLVFAYAGDVIARRGQGALAPVLITTALLAVSAPVAATTLLLSRDVPFGVLHLLLALLMYDIVGVRRHASLPAVTLVAALTGVLSVLRGDGIVLLLVPFAFLLLRPRGSRLVVGAAVTATVILAIRLVAPAPLTTTENPYLYGMTLKISVLSSVLARTADAERRRADIAANDRASFDAAVVQPFASEDARADRAALAAVIDVERVENLATPYEIPAFWAGAYEAAPSPEELARFNAVANRLIRDNLATVVASKLETFAAASGLSPGGFTGVPLGGADRNFDWVTPVTRRAVDERMPWPAGLRWLSLHLERSAKYSGLHPAGAALWWNLLPWMGLLAIPLFAARRFRAELLFSSIILLRVPLVFLAAPAAQWKYYYSVYLGGVVCLGLLLAAILAQRRGRAAAPTETGAASAQPAATTSGTDLSPAPLSQHRLVGQLLRFAGVSGTGLAVDYGVYTALTMAGAPAALANLCSASCAVTLVYFISLRHVFQSRPTHRTRPFASYAGYQALAVPLASVAVGAAEGVLDGQYLLAKSVIVPFSFAANFIFMRWLLSPPPTTPLAGRVLPSADALP